MKKYLLLGLLDVLVGIIIGFVGYQILNHRADVVDWCLIAICFVVLAVRIYIIIKDTIKAANKGE